MSDPPKKKHKANARPIVVTPLTESERRLRAASEFAKARAYLDELEKISVIKNIAIARVHLAYYAMHHCACAAILMSGGVGKLLDFPKSHQHVLEHFAKIVAGEPGYLAAAGQALSRAKRLREMGDYEMDQNPSQAEADEAAEEAFTFLAACSARWDLPAKI